MGRIIEGVFAKRCMAWAGLGERGDVVHSHVTPSETAPTREGGEPALGLAQHDKMGQEEDGGAELKTSMMVSKAVLEALPMPIYITDAEGKIDFYNPAASDLWGHRPVIGESRWCGSWCLYWPDGRLMRHDESPLAASLKEGRPLRGLEAVAERPNGTRVPFLSYPILLRDKTGRIIGALNLLVDITERKNAFIANSRLAAIVESSEDAIISKTLDGTITTWNAGAMRIFGYSAEDMIGHPISRIIPEELRDDEQEIVAQLRLGHRIDHYDTVRLAKDGRRVNVSLSISPLYDAAGRIIGASKIARDVTERKQVERDLKDAIAAAQEARIEAERANSAKTEFLAVMSHEIRTPLTGLSGFAELLSRTGRLSREQRRYIELVRSATAALLTIVNDILDFSKVEKGHLDLDERPFSLKALINETITIVQPVVLRKNLTLRSNVQADIPDLLMGDDARLRQILLNLLNNAVKFTEEGSITINVHAEPNQDGREMVRFAVSDTGIGIAVEQQHRLFKQFSQAHSSISRQHGGTGLGLAICKRLAELMGGEVGIMSEAGKGATLWFTAHLPPSLALEQKEPEVTPEEHETQETCKARILLVDDMETNREIVSTLLEDNGYRVDSVASGVEAIDRLKDSIFDMVLMDIQMPIMDGLTATKRIRALPLPIKDIPIIAMSGNVLPQQVKTFLDAGMNDHVGKPIESAKLYNTVWRWRPRAEHHEGVSIPMSSAFNHATLDELVAQLSPLRVERIARRFAKELETSFRGTMEEAQREVHDLLNVAGVLGFKSFVELCREFERLPPNDSASLEKTLDRVRRAQATVLQIIKDEVLPRLRMTKSISA